MSTTPSEPMDDGTNPPIVGQDPKADAKTGDETGAKTGDETGDEAERQGR